MDSFNYGIHLKSPTLVIARQHIEPQDTQPGDSFNRRQHYHPPAGPGRHRHCGPYGQRTLHSRDCRRRCDVQHALLAVFLSARRHLRAVGTGLRSRRQPRLNPCAAPVAHRSHRGRCHDGHAPATGVQAFFLVSRRGHRDHRSGVALFPHTHLRRAGSARQLRHVGMVPGDAELPDAAVGVTHHKLRQHTCEPSAGLRPRMGHSRCGDRFADRPVGRIRGRIPIPETLPSHIRHIRRDTAVGRTETFLQRQSRCDAAHCLPDCRHPLVHPRRVAAGGAHPGSQHPADAAFPAILIHDGWLRLCRGSPCWAVCRRARLDEPAALREEAFHVGHDMGGLFHPPLSRRR